MALLLPLVVALDAAKKERGRFVRGPCLHLIHVGNRVIALGASLLRSIGVGPSIGTNDVVELLLLKAKL